MDKKLQHLYERAERFDAFEKMPFVAQDIMSEKLVTAHSTMTCEEVMDLLVSNRITGVPVVNQEGLLLGVVSMYDILSKHGVSIPYSSDYFEESQIDRMLAEEGFHLEEVDEGDVTDLMSRNVFTIKPQTPVEEVAKLMYNHRIHRVIVLKPNEQKPIGIVSTFDLLKLMASVQSTRELTTP